MRPLANIGNLRRVNVTSRDRTKKGELLNSNSDHLGHIDFSQLLNISVFFAPLKLPDHRWIKPSPNSVVVF